MLTPNSHPIVSVIDIKESSAVTSRDVDKLETSYQQQESPHIGMQIRPRLEVKKENEAEL